tara:strand:+ start:6503 stop:7201 length:699 start_codon:yes stop_codon:yes gene_type:complete
MATANEIIFDILEDVRSSHITDDLDISERQVLYKIGVQRSLWIRNELNKPGRTIDPFIVQSLGCVELEATNSSECPNLPVGCTVLRTTCDLPKAVELHHREAITKVGPIDNLDYFFSFIPYQRAAFSGSGKYNKDSIFAFIYNKRMYFKVNSEQSKLLRKVNIMGIFEDPTEVSKFCNTDSSSCFSLDDEYPISNWMLPFIHEQVVKQLITSLQLPEDNSNDAASNERTGGK